MPAVAYHPSSSISAPISHSRRSRTLWSHDNVVMQAVENAHSQLSAEQHLLSPNSTGHTYGGPYHSHRCHSYSCKSAPTEWHRKENSREYKTEHWLFSPQPHRHHSRLAVPRPSSLSQARRAPYACRHGSLTPVSPNASESPDPKARWEHEAEDELISIWLSGVSYSDYPTEEADFTGQSTPAHPDPGAKVDALPTFTFTSFEEQPERRNRATTQLGTGLDGPQSSESDKFSKKLREELGDLKESTRSSGPSAGSRNHNSNTSGSVDWGKN